MKSSCCAAIAALLVLTSTGGTTAVAQSGGQPRDHQAFTASATAILVDVVVRDKKNRPVTDLTGEEFEVFEDGVAQKVDTFTRVSHGGGIGVGVAWKRPVQANDVSGGTVVASSSPADDPEESTTALVFDHLSSESLRLAQKATLDYIPMNGDATTRVGVFSTEPSMRQLQRYTTDRALMRQAVQRVLPAALGQEEQKAERVDELVARRRELTAANESASSPATGAAAAAANAQNMSERDSELQTIRAELDMLQADASLDRAHRGHTTAEALLTVVQTLAPFPGRKAVVFFSEGLPASPALSARLDWVIDAANRANITAYAVDAKGLRAKSTLEKPRKEMEAFVEERFNQIASGTDRTDQPLTMAFERVEDTIRLDSRTGLARFAEETGGFLVEGSNNLAGAFKRIDEDNQFHYLLSYSPKNTTFDGKFRAIQVKVHRAGTQVFARKGYRAIGSPRALDANNNYEAPALELLNRTPLPNAFAIHAAGFSFPDPARPGLTPVVVRVATDALEFSIDSQRSTYSAQVAIVVRVRDVKGRDVQKLSQQYVLTGDAKDLGAARKGEILFYREPDLPPGVYSMETIAFDSTAARGSARIATLTVPPSDASALGMSSLVLVSRAEEVKDAPAADPKTPAPLYVGHTLLYPNLGEPFKKSTTGELPFYFALYGHVQGADASVQLLRNGQAIAEAPIQLAAEANGRVQQVGRLPISALPSGTYELRIRVTDGAHELSRTAYFTLID